MAETKAKRQRAASCDPVAVKTFDYSRLSSEFSKLAKPAQRGLINNGIYTPRDLAKWTRADLEELHGIGPSSMPVLNDALRRNGLTFKA